MHSRRSRERAINERARTAFFLNATQCGVELNLTRVKLLLDRETGNIIAYMALLCDAIQLDTEEVQQMGWDIPFRTIPALKIGKLAVNQAYERHHYGSFMLWLALGFAENLLHEGIACRFLTVDADVLSSSDNRALVCLQPVLFSGKLFCFPNVHYDRLPPFLLPATPHIRPGTYDMLGPYIAAIRRPAAATASRSDSGASTSTSPS